MKNDIKILRDLAKEYMDTANKEIQCERRKLWSSHNSFIETPVPIYIRAFAWREIMPYKDLKCESIGGRYYEDFFRMMKFRDTIGDDFIIEPWITMPSVFKRSHAKRWSDEPVELGEKPMTGGAAAFKPILNELGDFDKLITPSHEIDKQKTMENYEKLNDLLGDIVPIDIDTKPQYFMWSADLSTDIAKLRGLEQIMWDVYDNPEFLHKILSHMQKSVLKVHEEAEKAGDWHLSANQNQAMAYADELEWPEANSKSVKRSQLWGYMASQEYTLFSPDDYFEFMLQYQIPILEKFGLSAYGCCEDLTKKIPHLKKIKNLRRLAVTPFCDVRECAEQIGSDYIASWRPDPSAVISRGLDEDYVRGLTRESLEIFKQNNCSVDVTLKDVETIMYQPENIKKFVKIVREEAEKIYG